MFSDQPMVIKEASKLGYFTAAAIFLNGILPVLHGVAMGAGWQTLVAVISVGSYYLLGLPVGAGMLAGYVIQLLILFFIFFRANWKDEAVRAEERIRTWGGSQEEQIPSETNINGHQRT